MASRKPADPVLPEWIIQAAMIAEWHKLEAEGWELTCAGDMNAGKRSWSSASQAKAMGLTPGETDTRLYGYPGRLLMVEVKTTKGKLSAAQVARHDRLAALGFQVLVVTPKDQVDARLIARKIAIKFCEAAL